MAIKKKRGGSHIGFILSFAIFVIFIIFLFIIIAPANKRKTQRDFILDKLSDDIVENVTGELTTFEINVNPSFPLGPDNCFVFTPPIKAEEVVVKDYIGDIVPTRRRTGIGSDEIHIKRINPISDKFFHFFIADNIPEPNDESFGYCDSNELTEPFYNLGQINSQEYILKWYVEGIHIFPSEYTGLVEHYNNNYDGLKKHFGVPELYDFYFTFEDAGGNLVEPNSHAGLDNPPDSEEVFVKELSLNYIDEEANINRGLLIVKLW